MRTHIGHNEQLGFVGVPTDEVNTLIHDVDAVEFLFDDKIELVVDNVHVAVLILHVEGFRTLQQLLHAWFAQKSDESRIFGKSAMGTKEQLGRLLLRGRIGILSQHFFSLGKDNRHIRFLRIIEFFHNGLVLVKGLLVAFGRGTGNDQRGTGIINKHRVHLIDNGKIMGSVSDQLHGNVFRGSGDLSVRRDIGRGIGLQGRS